LKCYSMYGVDTKLPEVLNVRFYKIHGKFLVSTVVLRFCLVFFQLVALLRQEKR